MANQLIYTNIRASLQAFCKTIAEQQNVMLPDAPPLSVVDYDATQEDGDLPKTDTIGPANVLWTVEGKVITVECMIGITTLEDKNNFRLHTRMAELFALTLPECRIPYVHYETGTELSQFVVLDGVRMMPVETDERPARFVMFQAALNRTTFAPG